ncbi:MAG: hypothetical protein EBU88_13300 [Acidobacteria bacterium]|nr:hypothetical protein [Acidobacteriota bacterium]
MLTLEDDQVVETSSDLTSFFAWARERAYAQFERLMAEDPKRDPNWTFSDVMQQLLEEYRQPTENRPSSEVD